MNKEGKVYVAGHRGMVGSALVRKLKAADFNNIITLGDSDKENELKLLLNQCKK